MRHSVGRDAPHPRDGESLKVVDHVLSILNMLSDHGVGISLAIDNEVREPYYKLCKNCTR